MDILENQVFIGNKYSFGQPHRRVVGLLGNYIYYSNGGDTTRACQDKTFIRWVKSSEASILIPNRID